MRVSSTRPELTITSATHLNPTTTAHCHLSWAPVVRVSRISALVCLPGDFPRSPVPGHRLHPSLCAQISHTHTQTFQMQPGTTRGLFVCAAHARFQNRVPKFTRSCIHSVHTRRPSVTIRRQAHTHTYTHLVHQRADSVRLIYLHYIRAHTSIYPSLYIDMRARTDPCILHIIEVTKRI